jgi:hypothetical protein
MRNLLLGLAGATAIFVCGCCSLLHIGCPTQTSYWEMQDELARDLNKRFGDQNFWQIVPVPLANYPVGTVLDKGISTSTNCVFSNALLQTLAAEDRIPAITNSMGFDLQLKSPTNITAVTGGVGISYGKPVYIAYTHMTLQCVIPDVYFKAIGDESECKRTLRDRLLMMPDTCILVGYLKGQFQLSASHDFRINFNAAAYGANGTISFTNSGGWTVLETNSVPCFAVIATPKLVADKSKMSGSIEFKRPNYKAAAEATKPILSENQGPVTVTAVPPARIHGTFTISCDRLDMCADLYIEGDTVRWNNGVCGLPTDVPGQARTPTVIKADDWPEPFSWFPKWPPIEKGYRCQNCWSQPEELPYPLLPPNITITKVRVLNPEGAFGIEPFVPSQGVVKEKGKIVIAFRAGIGTINRTKAMVVWDGTY